MGRWAPDAQVRLQHAAIELFAERGYDATTVAGIAERAGLTERTFFRHFTDKREVLFFGSAALQQALVQAVDEAAPGLEPLEAVAGGLDAAATAFFVDRLAEARHRQAIIAAHPELQERELIKLAGLAAAVAQALRRRGIPDPEAALAAETGIAVFRIAFEAWTNEGGSRSLADHISGSMEALRVVAGGHLPARRRGHPTRDRSSLGASRPS